MSLELCVLASGSGGNCSAVRTPHGVVLIDAGIGPRTAARRLNGTGIALRDVRAICLTHLDRDHFSPMWRSTILQQNIAVFCHEDRRAALIDLCDGEIHSQVRTFSASFEPLTETFVHPIGLAHDREGSHGFVVEGFGSRIGYATDLGHVPGDLVRRFVDLNVLAIESNYDPQMQEQSPRPWFLKQRIMGGRGHLSNEQAFAAIREILDRCERRRALLPDHIVLLHRSRQCNCPRLVRTLFARDPRIARRLVLAEQFTRTPWLGGPRLRPLLGEQLMLAWG